MRTVLLISDFSVFTIAVGRKLILWWWYPVSKAVISVGFLVLCSISERDYYLYCGCLSLTWIYKGSETRMERMKDAWEGAVQDRKDGSWDHFSAYRFYQKYNWEKEEERQRVCVCVWSVLLVCFLFYFIFFGGGGVLFFFKFYFIFKLYIIVLVLLVCSLFWKSTFGEVEWLEWRCFPCAHSAFFIKHSCRGNQML